MNDDLRQAAIRYIDAEEHYDGGRHAYYLCNRTRAAFVRAYREAYPDAPTVHKSDALEQAVGVVDDS